MADNTTPPTPPSKSGAQPPLPSSGTTGRLPSATTHLPVKKGGAGKIVVMLSSVAKPPPAVTQALPQAAPGTGAPTKPGAADSSATASPKPPLPPKQVAPGKNPQPVPTGRLSTTTYVKLPPKTSAPQLTSFTSKAAATPSIKPAAGSKATPPPLPAKWSEPKKAGPQHIPPIKLNEQALQSDLPGESGESLFADANKAAPTPKPEGWKSLEPGELIPPPGGLQSLEVFERSQHPIGKPDAEPASTAAKDKAAPLIAPPLIPPTKAEPPPAGVGSVPALRPTQLPPTLTRPLEIAPPSSLQVAPRMLEKAPELPSEKLPPPVIPAEAKGGEPAANPPPLILPTRPLTPPASTGTKGPTSSPMKKSTPLIVSSTSPKLQVPKIAEAKPALKPPTLPKRSMPLPPEPTPETPAATVETPKIAEETKGPEKVEAAAPAVHAPEPKASTPEPKVAVPLRVTKEEVAPTVTAAALAATGPALSKSSEPVPLTRAERTKRRRLIGTLIFWCVLIPFTGGVLYVGSLYIGRETRIEGQVIPPAGLTLSNEVLLVSGRELWSESAGIADDLAKERTPLLEEIQERQDHVQRAQADVASREERIRQLQQQIQAAKDEIDNTVKQARDATQQVWDVDGAQIDNEYTSRLNELQKTFSDRAKSLNLKYEPDPTFQSPEVWANAYRLALYQVPAGVDSVKEHQWLADQMKQWRDFEKSLDDRKEQLRDKAAQIKLGPAPKIADLNTKIAELQQRSDSTAAEEAPLKEELQQAQAAVASDQTLEAGLDDKYYKELDPLPAAAAAKHIPLATNGRFSWVDDDPFAEGETERNYWIFARATRSDGRQYWMLIPFSIEKYHKICFLIDPDSFISTKAILRPNLSPDEQAE